MKEGRNGTKESGQIQGTFESSASGTQVYKAFSSGKIL
jgi:hypothetical protein